MKNGKEQKPDSSPGEPKVKVIKREITISPKKKRYLDHFARKAPQTFAVFFRDTFLPLPSSEMAQYTGKKLLKSYFGGLANLPFTEITTEIIGERVVKPMVGKESAGRIKYVTEILLRIWDLALKTGALEGKNPVAKNKWPQWWQDCCKQPKIKVPNNDKQRYLDHPARNTPLTFKDFFEGTFIPKSQISESECKLLMDSYFGGLADLPLEAITTEIIGELVIKPMEAKKPAHEIKHYIEILLQVWNLASAKGVVNCPNPIAKDKQPLWWKQCLIKPKPTKNNKKNKLYWNHPDRENPQTFKDFFEGTFIPKSQIDESECRLLMNSCFSGLTDFLFEKINYNIIGLYVIRPMKEAGKTQDDIKHVINILSQIWHMGIETGAHKGENPVNKIKHPKWWLQ